MAGVMPAASATPAASITVDGLVFALRWSRRRRTIGITVARDGTLRVLAPRSVPRGELRRAVAGKVPWVRRKLAEFAAEGPPPPPKRLVDGERLAYLGRTHRLVVVDGGDARRRPVALRRGCFEVSAALDGDRRAAMVSWYTERAAAQITARVARFAPLVGTAPEHVVVRDLGKRRWGTCDGRTRTVSFHWGLILHPPAVVDYVVVHELAHLHELNHGPAFWRRVARVLPDYKARRKALSQQGSRHVA
jgi:predicted metal-dependent hydrolase